MTYYDRKRRQRNPGQRPPVEPVAPKAPEPAPAPEPVDPSPTEPIEPEPAPEPRSKPGFSDLILDE